MMMIELNPSECDCRTCRQAAQLRMTLLPVLLLAAAAQTAKAAQAPIMNGPDPYRIANPASAAGAFPAGGGLAPPFRGSYIEVYSVNISTLSKERRRC